MKKLFNNKLFLFILVSIISMTIGVCATNVYYSYEIKYSPSDTTWNISNVSDALNELHSLYISGDATADNILKGKKAVVGGKTITGTLETVASLSTISMANNYNYTVGTSGTYTVFAVGLATNSPGYTSDPDTRIYVNDVEKNVSRSDMWSTTHTFASGSSPAYVSRRLRVAVLLNYNANVNDVITCRNGTTASTNPDCRIFVFKQ